MFKHLLVILVSSLAATIVLADADITLSGERTADYEYTAASDTTIHLNGVTFDNCRMKLAGNVTYTLDLVAGTVNSFTRDNKNDYCIKATKSSNLRITGKGELKVYSTKKLDPADEEGLVTCNNLTIEGGNTKIEFDNDKSDTPCLFLKGNYLQTGGKLKVTSAKKNCTNEFVGVSFFTKNTTFTLQDGEFNGEFAGTKSRAIDLKKSCTATFDGGKCLMEFEGPQGRFVSGGTLVFNGGEFTFTTNVTAKMTSAYYPVNLSAVKADYSITINGGEFEADLPLAGSEVFTTDDETGTDITITDGDLDLVAENDCIHAKQDILILGGRIRARSLGDDALDANRRMTITGGDIRAYATASGAHGLDVNKGETLTISGGIVIATDGVGAIPIGSGSSEVGRKSFVQTTYYGAGLPVADYSGKYLTLEGSMNSVAFTIKPRLPDFTPPSGNFNLLVSVPGRPASAVAPQSAADAYKDASTRNPMVFERKARVQGQTVTTSEGALLTVAGYYDLTPSEGKTKIVTLALNDQAIPLPANPAEDGVEPITVGESVVTVGVKTKIGLNYQLQKKTVLDADPTTWTDTGATRPGTGKALGLSDDTPGAVGFYQVKVTD